MLEFKIKDTIFINAWSYTVTSMFTLNLLKHYLLEKRN